MKKLLLWVIALLITVLALIFQRVTGPTYPLQGKIQLANSEIHYKFLRSHQTGKDCPVTFSTKNPEIEGILFYKRYHTNDPWTKIPFKKNQDELKAFLPSQPRAGKLYYKVILSYKGNKITLPPDGPAVIRFKGKVPSSLLILHIVFMFLAMLFSTRAGLEALRPQSNPRKLTLWTTGLLFVGGFIFGPLVQQFAFGQLWTGFPFGFDLTDNKTLIAFIGWGAALIAGRGGKPNRKWVLGASILLLAVYLIPHSLLGSELKYTNT